MSEKRSLKELFDIVKKHHSFFSDTGTVPFMCVAATSAFKRGDIDPHEKERVKRACMVLVRNYNSRCTSLEAALLEAGLIPVDANRERSKAIIVDTWNEYIKALEN